MVRNAGESWSGGRYTSLAEPNGTPSSEYKPPGCNYCYIMVPIIITGPKIRFPILGNVQCRARFHVDFSETEGNFALYCTISFTFPSMQTEKNATFL